MELANVGTQRQYLPVLSVTALGESRRATAAARSSAADADQSRSPSPAEHSGTVDTDGCRATSSESAATHAASGASPSAPEGREPAVRGAALTKCSRHLSLFSGSGRVPSVFRSRGPLSIHTMKCCNRSRLTFSVNEDFTSSGNACDESARVHCFSSESPSQPRGPIQGMKGTLRE